MGEDTYNQVRTIESIESRAEDRPWLTAHVSSSTTHYYYKVEVVCLSCVGSSRRVVAGWLWEYVTAAAAAAQTTSHMSVFCFFACWTKCNPVWNQYKVVGLPSTYSDEKVPLTKVGNARHTQGQLRHRTLRCVAKSNTSTLFFFLEFQSKASQSAASSSQRPQ